MMRLIFFPWILLVLVQSQPVTIDYSANQKMSFVGQCAVNIAYQTSFMNKSNWNTDGPYITTAMPSTLSVLNISNLEYYAILGQYQTYSVSRIKIFIFRNMINSTQLQFLIKTYDSSVIKKLTIKYLVYTKEESYIFQVVQVDYYYGYNGTKISLLSYGILYTTLTYPLNLSNQYNIVNMISGINAIYNINNIFDISISTHIYDSNHIKTVIQSKKSFQYTILNQIFMTTFIYANPTQSKMYRYFQGKIMATNGSSYLQTSSYETTNFNTLVGLNTFYLYNQSEFSFSVSINQSNHILISTKSSFGSYYQMGFDYLIINSYYCDYQTPYLQQTNQICYSQCPLRTKINDLLLSCQCIINNKTVNNSQCLSQMETIESSSEVGLIVASLVSSTIALVLLILFIHKCYKTHFSKPVPAPSPPPAQSPKKVKSSKSISLDTIVDSVQVIYRQQLKQDVVNPWKNKLASIKQPKQQTVDKKQKQRDSPNKNKKRVKSKRSIYFRKNIVWQSAHKPISSQQCCACLSNGAFVVSQCDHSFHLMHLLEWLKDKDTCPLCLQKIQGSIKYYCNQCWIKYRILKLNEEIDQSNMEKKCDDCE